MEKTYKFSNYGVYAPLPESSPYGKLTRERLENPKFTFRACLDLARQKKSDIQSWLDIGSANGEFLDYLNKNLGRKSNIVGVEITEEFQELAAAHFVDVENVEIILGDFLCLTKGLHFTSSDVVSCLGTFPIFPEPEELLHKLLDAVNPGGCLVVDGRFNRHDISLVLNYRDESDHPSDLWRCDFNVHSEKMINGILNDRSDIEAIEFHYPQIDVDIPKKSGSPHRRVWTETGRNGERHVRNGMLQVLDPSFLVVVKC